MPLTTRETIPDFFRFGDSQPGTLIGDSDVQPAILRARRDLDPRAGFGIFHSIVEYLNQCLLHQYGIDVDQRQIGRHIEGEAVIREAMATPLHSRVDDVGGVRPLDVRFDAIAADAGCIQQILDVVVEALCFVTYVVHKGGQFLFLAQSRCCAQHRRSAEDRRKRCAQLVADRSDQCLAQLIRLRAHAGFADGVGDAEPLERSGCVSQHCVDSDAQFVRSLF